MPGNESIVDGGCLDGMKLTELCELYGADLLGTQCVARYGRRFPLLVKFIDAHSDLSLQVHPDDATAARLHGSEAGKTEMWYVLKSTPGANITLGFSSEITHTQFLEAAGKDAIMDLVEKFPTQPGAAFMIPAGTLHSIGAGNFLAEIQQSSDLTYRVYDYGRKGTDGHPRRLHIDEAAEAVNLCKGDCLSLTPRPTPEGADILADTEYFKVYRRVISEDGTVLAPSPESFRVLMCVDGAVTIEGFGTLTQGFSVLVPACAPSLTISGRGTLLQAQI